MSGLSDKITGKAKQSMGDASGDSSMKAEGKIQELKGHAKDKINEISHKIDHHKEDDTKSL